MSFRKAAVIATSLCGLAASTNISAVTLHVASGGGNATSGLQYGLMFEDINHSGDGGIYAELIQNRAFQANSSEFATTNPWTGTNCALSIDTSNPLSSALPWSMKVSPTSSNSSNLVTVSNPGWWGIDVQPQEYKGSFWVRGSYSGTFQASLQSNITGKVLAATEIRSVSTSSHWVQHNFTLTPNSAASNSNNSISLSYAPQNGEALNFNLISLFPPTYKNRENGMRVGLMEHLTGLNPSFHRIPGGNNLEGESAPNRWIWNQTIGPLIDRPGRPGTWNYYNTDGLGLAEYLNWCIDLAIEPILALWGGFYLDGTAISENDLGLYVDDALNELEYVLGSVETTYGSLRASHGYPSPWKVNFVEIGNEDNLNGGLESYRAYRFDAFYTAIKERYPCIKIISSTTAITVPKDASADYHQYTRPDDFVSQFGFFDQNTTGTSQVFIGEYATVQPNIPGGGGVNWSDPRSASPFWIGTVAEAVFLLGAERNAGSILGAAYAPLLQNLNQYQWAPDLVSFTADPAQDVLSTSYHQVALYSATRFTETLPVQTNSSIGPAYWVAGKNSDEKFYGLKAAVYNSTEDIPFTVAFPVAAGTKATLTVLTAENAFDHADIGFDPVVRTTTTLTASAQGFAFSLPNLSVAVLRTESVDSEKRQGPYKRPSTRHW